MTYRILIVGRRRDGMTHEACLDYLEREHTALIKDLPGLHRFSVSVPTDPDDVGFDEVAELRFTDAAALEEATASKAWQRAIADAENFVDLEESLVLTVEDDSIVYRSIPEHV